MCGQRVTVQSADEGTTSYRGLAEAEVDDLRVLVAECYRMRVENGGYIPSHLGDRLRDELGGHSA